MSKADVRRAARTARRELSDAEYASRCAAIRTGIERLPEWRSSTVIHSYWPMIEQREIDLRPLLRAHLAREGTLVLPVMDRSAHGEPILRHRLLEHEDHLRANEAGVLEPIRGAWMDPESVELILVPALAVRLDGHRLGYGGGYYDRFLGGTDAVTVSPVFEACITDAFSPSAHDVAVDVLVTEERIHRPR